MLRNGDHVATRTDVVVPDRVVRVDAAPPTPGSGSPVDLRSWQSIWTTALNRRGRW